MMEVIGYLGACKHMAVPGQWASWICLAMGWVLGYPQQLLCIGTQAIFGLELSGPCIQESILQEMFLR